MDRTEIWPDNPFWDFSIDFYGRKGVAKRLIDLQESLRIDVNMVLYCYWAAYIGAPILRESQIEKAINLVEKWQNNTVVPLREVRTNLRNCDVVGDKKWFNKVRYKVKVAELEAERFEQWTLYNELELDEDPNLEIVEKRTRATTNVSAYFKHVNKKTSPETVIILEQLLKKLFD